MQLSQLIAASRRYSVGTASPYVTAVLADSPYAYYRLNDPAGSTSIADSSGNDRHVSGVNPAITFGHPAIIADSTSRSALFPGTAGISLGSTLAAAVLGHSTWSVEFTMYPDPTNGTPHAGYPIAGAASPTQRFAVQHFNNTVYTQSTVGGIKSTATSRIIKQPHHFVLCSDGTVYWNGASFSGPTNPTLNSTVGMWLGALNSGSTGFFRGRLAEISFYQTVLSPSRVTAHYSASRSYTVPAGRTFRWGMESQVADQAPAGGMNFANYFSASLTTDQAFAGTQSLNCTGNFFSAWFDNGHAYDMWAGLNSAAVRFKFRYSGTITNTLMLFQMTGKDLTGRDDTNDGMALLITTSTGLLGIPITSIPADTWHDVIYRFNRAGPVYTSLTLNETTTVTNTTTPPAAVTCQAWHQLLIGNDRAYNPAGLWLDEFEVHGSWNSPDLPSPP